MASTSVTSDVSIEPLGVVYSLAALRKVGMLGDNLHLRTPPVVVSSAIPKHELGTSPVVAPVKHVAAPLKHVVFQGHLPYSVPVHWQTKEVLTTGAIVPQEPRTKRAPKSALKSTNVNPQAVVTYASVVRNGPSSKPTHYARKQCTGRWQPVAQAKAAAAAAMTSLLPTAAAQVQGHPSTSY
jgi:hypothetical protein